LGGTVYSLPATSESRFYDVHTAAQGVYATFAESDRLGPPQPPVGEDMHKLAVPDTDIGESAHLVFGDDDLLCGLDAW
jgi:hypothetical protein